MTDQTTLGPLDTYPSLEDVLGQVDAPSIVVWAVRAMEWAEEAIEEAKRRHPARATLLDRAFPVLCPRSDVFEGRGSERMIRAHMDELLDRIGEHGPAAEPQPATAAECCCVLAELSLTAPLKHRHHMAYLALFVEAFGEDLTTTLIGEEPVRRARMDREDHLVAEIIDQVREAAAHEDRAKEWKKIVADIDTDEAA